MAETIQEEVEDKIIDCINSGVDGRLIVFKPENNNFGADLAIEKRGDYKGKEIYFKINSLVGPSETGGYPEVFVRDFPQEIIKRDKNFYMIFVYFDEVTQKIGDYVWLIPSSQFEDASEVIKLPDGQKVLRFEASLDAKKKNKYSRFLLASSKFGMTIFGAFKKGGKFDLPADLGGFEDKKPINLEDLKEFIVEARKNTFAGGASSVSNLRLLASTQLEFQRGVYFYRDVFFSGEKRVVGQEIVYQDSKPVWGMSYIGSTIGKAEINFLKESLLELADKCRFGAPSEYVKRELKYQDRGQGNLDSFSGTEEIFLEGKNIYQLSYNGGIISDKL